MPLSCSEQCWDVVGKGTLACFLLCVRIRLEVGDSSVSFATVTPFLSNFVIRGPFLIGRKMFCSKQAILILCFPGGGEGVECSTQLSKAQSAVNRGDTGLGRWWGFSEAKLWSPRPSSCDTVSTTWFTPGLVNAPLLHGENFWFDFVLLGGEKVREVLYLLLPGIS